MSERKGPPSSDDRRKFGEPWRYGRYGSSGSASNNSNSTSEDPYNNNYNNNSNNNNTNGGANNNSNINSNSHSSRRFNEQRPLPYLKSRSLSASAYNGGGGGAGYNRYSSYDSKYQSGYGYNKRYSNVPYRSTSSSSLNTTAAPANQEHFHRSTSSAGVPITNSQQPFPRYRSSADETNSSATPLLAAYKGKRSGDLINNNSRVTSYSSSGPSYDSRDPYRPSRFHGYNSREHNNGYDSRYRSYQRKSSFEHKKKESSLEEDDLIYGSIKPKIDKLKEIPLPEESKLKKNEGEIPTLVKLDLKSDENISDLKLIQTGGEQRKEPSNADTNITVNSTVENGAVLPIDSKQEIPVNGLKQEILQDGPSEEPKDEEKEEVNHQKIQQDDQQDHHQDHQNQDQQNQDQQNQDHQNQDHQNQDHQNQDHQQDHQQDDQVQQEQQEQQEQREQKSGREQKDQPVQQEQQEQKSEQDQQDHQEEVDQWNQVEQQDQVDQQKKQDQQDQEKDKIEKEKEQDGNQKLAEVVSKSEGSQPLVKEVKMNINDLVKEPAVDIISSKSDRESSVSSDQYDPAELPISLATTNITEMNKVPNNDSKSTKSLKPIVKKATLISSIRDAEDEMDVDDELEKTSDELNENYLPKKIEGAFFPLNRLEFKLWDLKENSKRKVRSQLPYLRAKPLKDFNRYPFYNTNLLIHQQAVKPKLLRSFSHIKRVVSIKEKKLYLEFHERDIKWKERVKLMEEQLKRIRKPETVTDDSVVLNESTESKSTLEDLVPPNSASSRRVRNTGVVNSEAEFAEILQRMKEEEENDPLFRARQAAAVIPDMIIDPIEKNGFKFISTNNLVTDLEEWESRLVSDKIDNFSKREHEMFCDAYASFPKRFGKISTIMEHRRSPEECVLHYYRTKRQTNYKQLVAAKNKRLGRKSGSARVKGKQSNKSRTGTQTTNTPTSSTPVSSTIERSEGYFPPDGQKLEENIEIKEVEVDQPLSENLEDITEVSYTESGRRKRAAAPVFDSKVQSLEKEENPSTGTLDPVIKKSSEDIERPKLKKQRSSKRKVKIVEEAKTEDEDRSGGEFQDVAAHQLELLRSYATAAQVLPETSTQEPLKDELPLEQSLQSDEPFQGQPILEEALMKQSSELSQEMADPFPITGGQLKISKKDKKPPHITSYWSINDANKFPSILAECGTQWHLIAKKIQTKTTTMVRNYYSKNANSVNNWAVIAREADLKRNGTENGNNQIYGHVVQQYQQAPLQMELYPNFQQQMLPQQQSLKLPSLKDITNGISDMSNHLNHLHLQQQQQQQQHFQPPPTFGSSSLLSGSRDDEEKKYAIVLNPSTSAATAAMRPVQLPPPSRTSIMSLLNNEPSHQIQRNKPLNPLDNLLNPTTSYSQQSLQTSSHQQPQSLPLPHQPPPNIQQPPSQGGLFSLAALAEVATEVTKSGFTTEDK